MYNVYLLPAPFWPCPPSQVEIQQTEVKHQLIDSSKQFPYVFHKKLFCHFGSRVRMVSGSSSIFLQKSMFGQMFKSRWICYSRLCTIPSRFPAFARKTTLSCLLSAAPFGCSWGKPGVGSCFHRLQKSFLTLFSPLDRGKLLAEFSLSQFVSACLPQCK